jgi:hypothetical protein
VPTFNHCARESGSNLQVTTLGYVATSCGLPGYAHLQPEMGLTLSLRISVAPGRADLNLQVRVAECRLAKNPADGGKSDFQIAVTLDSGASTAALMPSRPSLMSR